ncbi:hypothetical protein WJX81_006916 [Elliptochloris bilobata]|uniref:TraB domain-containing protein n=1 Tax=Elliptochloris bilobata TaxID=381761 RepID=A0AAW1QJL5_9CHLO
MDVGLALEEESVSAIDTALLPQHCAVLSAPGDSPGAFGPRRPRCDFYIIGTAHVSAGSCEDVRRVIQLVRPEVVMLELCVERKDLLAPQRPQSLDLRQLLHLWRAGRISLLAVVLQYVMSSVSTKLGADLGEEMRVAVVEAQKVGAKVLLGDRPISVTLARIWAALSAWERSHFIWNLLTCGDISAEAVEQLRGSPESLTEMMEQLAAHFPTLSRPMVAERDEYMAFRLRMLAPKATRVVAVVGAGHVSGIRGCWEKEIDFAAIAEAPPPQEPSAWPLGRVVVLTTCAAILSVTCIAYLRRR